jgi:hypothetical protein
MARKINAEDMLPRPSYSLFIMTIPHLRGKELRQAVQNHLVGMYPGSLENKSIAIKKNGHEKWSYIVFILEYGADKNLAPSSTLFLAYYFTGKSANAVYVYDNWVEFALIEKGKIISSIVKLRNDIEILSIAPQIFDNNAENIDIFCKSEEAHFFDGALFHGKIVLHQIDQELNSVNAEKIYLFDKFNPGRKRKIILFALLILSATAAGGLALYERHKSLLEEADRIIKLQEQQKLQSEAEKRDLLLLTELRQQHNEIVKNKKTGPFEVAEAIALSLDSQSGIISATIQDGFFQLEANAQDALEILKAFENNRRIRSPMLQQAHPLNGMERFSISGTVIPEIEAIDQYLPIGEQINQLKERIQDYENSQNDKIKESPSNFGVNIRSLALKWGCRINSYQYLNAQEGKEIEFSVQAPSNRFFAFLQEASQGNNGWVFALVQIRNLAPQNALSVVFRVRAETIIDNAFEPAPDMAALSRDNEPISVARISRNYYAPAPYVPRQTADPPAASPAPPLPRREQAAWLEYVGTISDNDNRQYIYVKNTQTGLLLKLAEFGEGDMRYRSLSSGNFEAQMDGKLYEIRRR